jgi:uncharacterized protein YunC (DUF1805 family)
MSSADEGTPQPGVELLAELGAMKLSALWKRAEELGIDEDTLDEAEEKSEVIALILAAMATPVEDGAAKAEAEVEAETKATRLAQLKDELSGMKLRALQKRAEELGINEDTLDEAEEKSEVIALILAATAAAAEAETTRLAQLKDELSGMKLRALQKRAEELGINEDTLDEAEEKSEVIVLILAAMALAPAVDGAEHKEAELIASIRGSATEREAAYAELLRREAGHNASPGSSGASAALADVAVACVEPLCEVLCKDISEVS